MAAFAGLLERLRFQEWLASDADAVRDAKDYLAEHGKDNGQLSVIAKVWISETGRVDRLDFVGLDEQTSNSLRTHLMRGFLSAPPPDMLQPLHLKLSLGQAN